MNLTRYIQGCRPWLLLLFLALAGLGLSGCSTVAEDNDNMSSRPWNSPEGWQNGALPGQLTQPH